MTAYDLARAFVQMVADELTPEQLAEVARRNDLDEDGRVCHSHDFCDSNQCMIDALESLGQKFDTQDDAQRQLVNDAWDWAKMSSFDLDELESNREYFSSHDAEATH